ncbi:MAG: type II toxin-antitoxin system RelE/ParE family toxin [Roseateles sp.]|uniref:type II toxin-antitoxin system RelE/ParE family toxin n=1 Tax=Roseateles sp. TaxID=1971397 RepID=UPI0039ECA19C
MKLTLHPEAERDLADAAAFYEREASPVLAARFIGEFKHVVGLLAAHPDIGAPRANGCRSFGLRVFPYSVVYRVRPDGIEVLVVRHDHRRPGFDSRRR